MNHLTTYVTTTVVLAAGVVLYALQIRPNFYSACIYLTQNNYCILLLANFTAVCITAFLYGLQRLFYGPLRPIEVEQLYEKGWIALVETGLAMTLFRDDMGAWFLVMLVALMSGRVWGWIGESRVDFLEQQPPANPRTFHTRLSASLGASVVFSIAMLKYSFDTVVKEARPGIMVMFAFEFAILSIQFIATLLRYFISLKAAAVIKQQTEATLQARRTAHEAANRPGDQEDVAAANNTQQEQEEQEEQGDVDVPGWEDKGRYTFALDIGTDLLKLLVYLVFLSVIIAFHGFPLHLTRDLYITVRSFVKRLADFRRYRNATKDMNARYPDATAEDLAADNTCIICREEMTPWQPAGQGTPQAAGRDPPQPARPVDERLRAKKLPCGHVLHGACLRSWLERQQVCPTCRRSVLAPAPGRGSDANQGNERINRLLAPPPAGARAANAAAAVANPPPPGAPAQDPRRMGIEGVRRRLEELGLLNPAQAPLRRAPAGQHGAAPAQSEAMARQGGNNAEFGQRIQIGRSSDAAQYQLMQIEQQILQELDLLNLAEAELRSVRALQAELARLRAQREQIVRGGLPSNSSGPSAPTATAARRVPTAGSMTTSSWRLRDGLDALPPGFRAAARGSSARASSSALIRGNEPIHPPPGVTIPNEWVCHPLRPVIMPDAGGIATGSSGTLSAATAAMGSASASGVAGPSASAPLSTDARADNLRTRTPSWSFGGTSGPSLSQVETAAASVDLPPATTQRSSTPVNQQPHAATVEDAEDTDA